MSNNNRRPANTLTESGLRARSLVARFGPEYRVWQHMKGRCLSPKHPAFKHYGARGISVCERWAESYQDFIEDMGRRPPGGTLDRIDNAGNYEPGNCRWVAMREQNRNKRTNVWIEHDGRRMVLEDWAAELGIHGTTLRKRINNMPLQVALSPGKLSHKRGSENSQHKLTQDQAMIIKSFPKERGAASALAKRFGISTTVVYDIRSGKRWSHLTTLKAMGGQ